MSLTFDQVANIIIEASKTELAAEEDPKSVDSQSRNLVFSLQYHQGIFNANTISLSLIADLMGIDYYTEENAKKLIGILKSKLSSSQLNPAI